MNIVEVYHDVLLALSEEEWPWLEETTRESMAYFLTGLYESLPLAVESTLRLKDDATFIVSSRRVSYIKDGSASWFQWSEPFDDVHESPYVFTLRIVQCMTLAYLRAQG